MFGASDGGLRHHSAPTSAAKPSTWSFSVFRAFSVTKSGKLAFWTPSFLILGVEESCDRLPDEERAGPQDVASCKAMSGSYTQLSTVNDVQSCMLETREGSDHTGSRASVKLRRLGLPETS